jgi:CubicO group peptidase (beta-lactamase class C family)
MSSTSLGGAMPIDQIDEHLLADAVSYADRWLEYRQRTLRLPGLVAAVAHRGQVVLSTAHGMADLDRSIPMTPNHVFRVASHSKTFTATALMQLVEQGRIRLDDRMADWLPWLPTGRDRVGRATVRQLLSHSAGVLRDGYDGGFWQLERNFPDSDELRRLASEALSVLPTNERFKYSNVGFALLGLVLEAATGIAYNAHVRTAILERLGLANTGPDVDDLPPDRLATGYTGDVYGLDRLAVAHLHTGAMSPATGFYSTAEDLCRYAAAHLFGNEELISDDSKREMQREQWRVVGSDQAYGLGLAIYQIAGHRMVGHNGGFPGFITATRIDPRAQLVVVILTNASDGPATDLAAGVVEIIDCALGARKTPAAHPGVDRDRFVGRFWSLGGALDIVRFGSDLVQITPGEASPLTSLARLAVDGNDELTIHEAPGYASPGERVRFSFEGEHALQVQVGAATLYPWTTFVETIRPSVERTGRAPQRPPRPLP